MKRRFAHLKQLLFYGGLEKEKYRAIAADIDESNRSSLVVISFAYVMIYLTRLLVSYDTIPYTSRILFISAISFFGVIALVNCLTKGKRRFIHLSAYVFLAGYLGIGILSAVSEGSIQERTTLYLVYVSAAPMLFALNAVELTAIIVPAELLYLFMITRYQSMYPVYAVNCSNSFYFSIMGLLLGIYMSNMKIWGVYNAHMNSRMGEIERLNRELHQSREDLQEALFSAEQANRSKTIFLNNMSHDIRTPMNAIIGFTALAQKHIDNREQVENYLQKISVSSQHLLSLINDVLDMSHIESGKVQLEEKPLHLPKLIDQMETIIQANVAEKNLTFSADVVGLNHPDVMADKLRLDQVLLNMLSNAVKFTPPGGKIDFKIIEKPGAPAGYADYEFHIKDTGIGMSRSFQKHIFEAFSREETDAVRGIQGTGLGMSIAKNIVDMMQGSIDIDSQEGRGTEFTVHLRFAVAQRAVNTEEKKKDPLAKAELAGKNILLVEDNELNQEIAAAILEEDGFIVDTAMNGATAVEKVRDAASGRYDLVLMDVQMPVMNGYEATQRIRMLSDPKKVGIPIIAMTANAFDEDRRAAICAGMDGYISKPIDIPKLMQTIKEVMGKKNTKG